MIIAPEISGYECEWVSPQDVTNPASEHTAYAREKQATMVEPQDESAGAWREKSSMQHIHNYVFSTRYARTSRARVCFDTSHY